MLSESTGTPLPLPYKGGVVSGGLMFKPNFFKEFTFKIRKKG
jgi:hypothetical protein